MLGPGLQRGTTLSDGYLGGTGVQYCNRMQQRCDWGILPPFPAGMMFETSNTSFLCLVN